VFLGVEFVWCCEGLKKFQECCLSAVASCLHRSPREVASSRPLQAVSQSASVVLLVQCCGSGTALCHGSPYLQGAIS
jgi:hypothetical protein